QIGDDGTVVLFFFFQAEDGIRDRNVTGVQTCALPICNDSNFASYLDNPHSDNSKFGFRNCGSFPLIPGHPQACFSIFDNPKILRSEERRVGKECRYRWEGERCRRKVKKEYGM